MSAERPCRAAKETEALWRERAARKEWDKVRAPVEVNRFSGLDASGVPRLTPEYREGVVSELCGPVEGPIPDRHAHLSAEDIAAAREVYGRKAAALWLKDTARSTVRAVKHDTVTQGAPVMGSRCV